AGFIGKLRTSFIIKKKLSEAVSLSFYEVPMVYFYDRPGTIVKGVDQANQVAENAMFFVSDFNITNKLSFEFPVYFQTQFFRDYLPGANHNAGVASILWIWPEL